MGEIRLDGRVAIVTGAGAGLGRAHALELARRGAAVVVNDLGGAVDGSGADAGPAAQVVGEITAAGGRAVADAHSVVDGGPAIVGTAMNAFGRVDIVVNNAGILRDRAFHNMSQADYDAVLDVHLRGAVSVTREAFIAMRAQGYGRIVNTCSTAGILGNFGQANYGSAKMGLYGLTRVLAIEGAPKGIKVNCIGPIAESRMTKMDEARASVFTPERVSALVAYLCSEECELTGELLSAAGGRIARFFMALTPGWYSADVTAENVRDHLGEIMAEPGYSVLRAAREEIEVIARTHPLPLPLPAGGAAR
jgi:NAD(P)-dependent dehydrogenase (short-subunit alcohol dehydrogenase family)